MQLMAIPGGSGRESAVAEFITDKLRRAGVRKSAIASDRAHKQSGADGASHSRNYANGVPGQRGNLIVKLPASAGLSRRPRPLLMAHMDTVPICVGSKPVRRGGRVVSADTKTGLGADDRAGCAAVLLAALAILESGLPHPPLTLLWTVQEEVGLIGARHVALNKLGRPAMAFNFDGGPAAQLVIGATGAYRMTIVVEGVAAHAGAHPQRGVSATAIAALAVADLVKQGWQGAVRKGGQRGTSNVGVIHGGDATNVVTDRVELRAEARSHSRAFRKRIVNAYRKAFTKAARAVRNDAGRCGKVTIDIADDYEAFALKKTDPAVRIGADAIRAAGLEPVHRIVDGGLDANWMIVHGIPTVSFGVGEQDIHTVNESLDLEQFHLGCRIALQLATGTV